MSCLYQYKLISILNFNTFPFFKLIPKQILYVFHFWLKSGKNSNLITWRSISINLGSHLAYFLQLCFVNAPNSNVIPMTHLLKINKLRFVAKIPISSITNRTTRMFNKYSYLHRPSIVSKHFLLFQLMHTIIKIIEILKQFKIIILVSTCFGSRRNHHQGAVLCLAKTTNMVFLCTSV